MNEQKIYELERQVAILAERMNTRQAEYRTDIGRLAEQHAQLEKKLAERDVRLAERDARLAERDVRLAERDSRFVLLIVSLIVGATAFLSFMIKF